MFATVYTCDPLYIDVLAKIIKKETTKDNNITFCPTTDGMTDIVFYAKNDTQSRRIHKLLEGAEIALDVIHYPQSVKA